MRVAIERVAKSMARRHVEPNAAAARTAVKNRARRLSDREPDAAARTSKRAGAGGGHGAGEEVGKISTYEPARGLNSTALSPKRPLSYLEYHARLVHVSVSLM